MEIGGLLARIGSGLFQQAYVIADFDRGKLAMRETFGCGEFVELQPADLDYELRGATVSCALAVGFARSGNMQIELIQPVRGEGLHLEFLAANGPGLHHLGFMVDNLDDVVASAGYAKLMGGQFGSLRFGYLDTFDELGLYVELVEDPDGMMMAMAPWR